MYAPLTHVCAYLRVHNIYRQNGRAGRRLQHRADHLPVLYTGKGAGETFFFFGRVSDGAYRAERPLDASLGQGSEAARGEAPGPGKGGLVTDGRRTLCEPTQPSSPPHLPDGPETRPHIQERREEGIRMMYLPGRWFAVVQWQGWKASGWTVFSFSFVLFLSGMMISGEAGRSWLNQGTLHSGNTVQRFGDPTARIRRYGFADIQAAFERVAWNTWYLCASVWLVLTWAPS